MSSETPLSKANDGGSGDQGSTPAAEGATPSESPAPPTTVAEGPTQSRRKYGAVFSRSRQQMRYVFIMFGGGTFAISTFVLIYLYSLRKELAQISSVYAVDPVVTEAIRTGLKSAGFTIAFFSLVLTVLIFTAGVIFGQRIFGPMVPIMRLIDELKAGNYSARGKLRKNDEFKDVMENLNDLAAKLEKR